MKASIQPIHKQSAEAQALEMLRQCVTNGTLAAGSKLTETHLAKQLEVSRGTLRTALHQLTGEGLIVQTPYTGWAVMGLSANDAWELYTLRMSLEGLAARLAATRATPEGLTRLKAAFENLKRACKAQDIAATAEADFALHQTVIALANHGRLVAQYRLVESQIRVYLVSSDALVTNPKLIVAAHKPIVDAIVQGDAARASSVIEQHIKVDGEILVSRLERMNRLEDGRKIGLERKAKSVKPRTKGSKTV